MNTLHKTWNLETIFEGGSESEQFHNYVLKTEQEISKLESLVHSFTSPQNTDQTKELSEIVDQIQLVTKRLGEIGAFISCLNAQDVNDKKSRCLAVQTE